VNYVVQGWGDNKRAGFSSFTVQPSLAGNDFSRRVALFQVNYDPEREERARMLAHKVCAFLNELEEKKAQITELMNIAGQ
jgi:hypothetical protein